MAELGALASVIGIAGAGAKLSIAIFEFASTIGSAAPEITSIGTEISQFCVVVKQIESTLKKAKKSVRYSLTALLAIESITDRCQSVFKEIEDILTRLKKGKAEPKLLGRLIWPVKRVKVEMLRKTLESSKLTLSCMLMTLLFAENIASRRSSTPQTQAEDEDQRTVTQSLIIAEQCSVDELEKLEDEEFLQRGAEQISNVEAASLSPVSRGGSTANRQSRIVDGELLSALADAENTSQQRNSILFNSVMFDDMSPTSRRQTWQEDLTSPFAVSQPINLLRKWTDEGDRLSKLVETPQVNRDEEEEESHEIIHNSRVWCERCETDAHSTQKCTANWNAFGVSLDEAERLYTPRKGTSTAEEIGDGKSENSTLPGAAMSNSFRPSSQELTHNVSSTISSKDQNSTQNSPPTDGSSYSSPSVKTFKSFRISIDDPCYKALPAALKKYNINDDWRQYALYLVYDDKERCLGLEERPLIIFRNLDREGKKPVFMLRKVHPAPK